MIKNTIILVICLGALTATAQQQQQQAYGNVFINVGLNNQAFVQRQSNPVVLASNQGNSNKQFKTNQTNKTVRRAPVQQNIARNINSQLQPLVINDNIQQFLVNVSDNNVGNGVNFIEQIAAAEIPAIHIGNGNLDINLEIKMPRLNLKINRKAVKSAAVRNSVKYQLFQVEKKLTKMHRKFISKLNLSKRLKIKVDNCFKW